MDVRTLCPSCFKEKGALTTCPLCAYVEEVARQPLLLAQRTILDGKYLVGRPLGKPGGFGITYLALDLNLNTRVAIKEYLPRELAGRDTDRRTVMPHSREDQELFSFGLGQFLQEARTLARFSHPNVVRVRSFFEENGTAYLVMDYYEGMTLAEYQQQQGGRLPEKQALDIMMPILDGLREVHEEGFLHRDIKPQNIYLAKGKNGVSPILLDFGAARFAMGERSRSLSVVLTPGFAPFEQYHKKGNQGAWTDIYACAATLYHLVTGTVPPEATERKDEDELVAPKTLVPALSDSFTQGLLAGLAVRPEERPQSVRAFQDLLLGSGAKDEEKPLVGQPGPEPETEAAPVKPQAEKEPESKNSKPSKKKRSWRLALALIAVLVLGATGIWQYVEYDRYRYNIYWAESYLEDNNLRGVKDNLDQADVSRYFFKRKKIVEMKESLDEACRHLTGEMIRIPGGTFQMGSYSGEADEKPAHTVTLSTFYLSKAEVTVGQFRAFVNETAYRTEAEQGDGSLYFTGQKWEKRGDINWLNPGFDQSDGHPVTCVSWNDALAFIDWLGKKTGRQYRFPTEAEWEYACRGRTTTECFWDNDDSLAVQYANVADAGNNWTNAFPGTDGYERTAPVAKFRPNPYGLHDMLGNVWEWCSDWYGPYPSSSQTNPQGPSAGAYRVNRGGSWGNGARNVRAPFRHNVYPSYSAGNLGFRLAKDL
jgi:formylglycine-generating enzyme required for sulfatase activity